MVKLKQNVPLFYDQNANPVTINLEFMQMLQKALDGAASTAAPDPSLTALTARVVVLEASVVLLQTALKKLQDGYQA